MGSKGSSDIESPTLLGFIISMREWILLFTQTHSSPIHLRFELTDPLMYMGEMSVLSLGSPSDILLYDVKYMYLMKVTFGSPTNLILKH